MQLRDQPQTSVVTPTTKHSVVVKHTATARMMAKMGVKTPAPASTSKRGRGRPPKRATLNKIAKSTGAHKSSAVAANSGFRRGLGHPRKASSAELVEDSITVSEAPDPAKINGRRGRGRPAKTKPVKPAGGHGKSDALRGECAGGPSRIVSDNEDVSNTDHAVIDGNTVPKRGRGRPKKGKHPLLSINSTHSLYLPFFTHLASLLDRFRSPSLSPRSATQRRES